jgi:hypothetical protein
LNRLYIFAVVLLVLIIILEVFELIVPIKIFQKKGIKYTISFSKLLTKTQLNSLLQLIDEKKKYHSDERRIIILREMWQLLLFDFLNTIILITFKRKKETPFSQIGGWYSPNYNYICIFEFNLKKAIKGDHEGISKEDLTKLLLVFSILHEYRHKYQFRNRYKVEEYDADRFAFRFAEYNRYKLKEILKLSSVMWLEKESNDSIIIHTENN